MRISLDIELKDVPGQLIHALIPISDFGGNILTVRHKRDKMTPSGKIPVQVVFELEENRLDGLLEKLKEAEADVVRLGKERLKESTVVLLVGHIIHTDVGDTIHSVDRTGFAEVTGLSLSMPGIDKKSSALFTISATNKENLEKTLNILKETADKKGILVVSSI